MLEPIQVKSVLEPTQVKTALEPTKTIYSWRCRQIFADDVKVYLELCNVSDVDKLQNALDLITGWANEWQLSLSVNKCNLLLIGKCQDNTPYYVNEIELPYLSHCKDSGVIITSELSPSLHIQYITAKAHQRANSIL